MSLRQLSYIILTPKHVRIPGEKTPTSSPQRARRQRSSSSPSQWLGRLVSKTKLLAPKSLRARHRSLNLNSNQAAALTSDIDPSSPMALDDSVAGNAESENPFAV